jgi:hypothetical protein
MRHAACDRSRSPAGELTLAWREQALQLAYASGSQGHGKQSSNPAPGCTAQKRVSLAPMPLYLARDEAFSAA